MKKLIQLKNGDEKCPHCGTVFSGPDMCPTAVEYRKRLKARRTRAAKRGWETRRSYLAREGTTQ